MTPPLTDDELAALEAAEKAATPGPWTRTVPTTAFNAGPFAIYDGEGIVASAESVTLPIADADATLIAHARNALPRLLTELRTLRAQRTAEQERADVVRLLRARSAHGWARIIESGEHVTKEAGE